MHSGQTFKEERVFFSSYIGICGAGDRKNYKANMTTFFLFQDLENTDEHFSLVETKNSSKSILHVSRGGRRTGRFRIGPDSD